MLHTTNLLVAASALAIYANALYLEGMDPMDPMDGEVIEMENLAEVEINDSHSQNMDKTDIMEANLAETDAEFFGVIDDLLSDIESIISSVVSDVVSEAESIGEDIIDTANDALKYYKEGAEYFEDYFDEKGQLFKKNPLRAGLSIVDDFNQSVSSIGKTIGLPHYVSEYFHVPVPMKVYLAADVVDLAQGQNNFVIGQDQTKGHHPDKAFAPVTMQVGPFVDITDDMFTKGSGDTGLIYEVTMNNDQYICEAEALASTMLYHQLETKSSKMPNINVNISKKKKTKTPKVHQANDFVGCWKQVEGPGWYEGTTVTFASDYTYSTEDSDTSTWAWSPQYITAEDFGDYNDWHFSLEQDSDGIETLTLLENRTWHGGATQTFERC